MSAAGALVSQRDPFSSAPAAAALGLKDIPKSLRPGSPGHVSQRSGQSPYSHVHTESIQITSTAAASGKEAAGRTTTQQVSTMHVVAVHTEDEQLVSHFGNKPSSGMLGVDERIAIHGPVGPPPPSPPASIEREILNETTTAETQPNRVRSQPSLVDVRNHVHMPPISKPMRERPTRRNTTGSSPSTPATSSRAQLPSFGAAFDDPAAMGNEAQELASEIQQAAEQIRRERLSKRAKQQAQQAEHDAVEAALARTDTRRSAGSGRDDVVLVGNLIGEGHVNYILMYNMLTGIRVGVRICSPRAACLLTSVLLGIPMSGQDETRFDSRRLPCGTQDVVRHYRQ